MANIINFNNEQAITEINTVKNFLQRNKPNYTKKVVSFFLIYTKNLTLENFNTGKEKIDLDIKKNGGIYGELLSYLQQNDKEFKSFEENILNLLKNNRIENIENLKTIMSTHTQYSSIPVKPAGSQYDFSIFEDADVNKSFPGIYNWKKTKYRNSWNTFKNSIKSKLSEVKEANLAVTPVAPNEKYLIINKEEGINVVKKADGNLDVINYSDNLESTEDIGTRSDRPHKTELILFNCLMTDNISSISPCLGELNNSLEDTQNGNLTPGALERLNPHLVLTLLHRLGFKSKDNKIINAVSWRDNVLQKITREQDTKLYNGSKLMNYLQNLVNYINGYDLTLLLNKPEKKYMYDPATNTNLYGRNIEKDKTSNPEKYMPLVGLSHFYEAHKSYGKTTTDFIDYLYGQYGFDIPQQIRQEGGTNLISSIHNGILCHKNLKEIFTTLINSTQKIKLADGDKLHINNLLRQLEEIENKLIKYIEFMNEVNNVDKMFNDIIPSTGLGIKSDDLDVTDENKLSKLKTNLSIIYQQYNEKRDTVSKLISSIADMELNPEQNTSKYDAFDL
jgi:hypothetical protein